MLQHGGKIWVESAGEPGRGTTFHVSVPLRAAGTEGGRLTALVDADSGKTIAFALPLITRLVLITTF